MTNQEVYQIFVDFFGEDKIDFWNDNTIIVFFPKVRVTNENDKYTDIYELFVRVCLDQGKLYNSFALKRSKYTEEQYASGYCHSHVPKVLDDYSVWKSPCLGTGPIRSTTASLVTEGTEELWQLFCVELNKYVATESLTGGPYIRLETIGADEEVSRDNIAYQIRIDDSIFPYEKFLMYIFKNKPFTFNYCDYYNIALSEKDIIVTLSNLFIKWYNEGNWNISVDTLLNSRVLIKSKIKDNKIYEPLGTNIINDSIEQDIITFKNKVYHLTIIKTKKVETDNSVLLLNNIIINTLVTNILNYINYGTTINKRQRFI